MSFLGAAYGAVTRGAQLLAPAALALRGVDAVERGQRLGHGSTPPVDAWWHAASVGEVMALEPILEEVLRAGSRTPLRVTTQTRTGQAAARARWGDAVRFAPLDLPGVITRALDGGSPRSFIFVETELWPNWLAAANRRGILTAVVNGRLSDGAWPRTRRLRSVFAPLLAPMRAVAARTERDAERFRELGAPAASIRVTGNVKHDRVVEPVAVPVPWPDDPVWVVGSLRPGEDAVILDAFRALRTDHPRLRLVLAPRHPDEWSGLDDRLGALGWNVARRSRPEPGDPDSDVLIVDGHGELGGLYARATVAFVGGTLAPIGGHNVMEAAVCGAPVVVGPHVATVLDEVVLLEAAGAAIRVTGAEDMASRVDGWLTDDAARATASGAARDVALQLRGASARTVAWLRERGVLDAG